jgi:hypothetical protein
MSCIVLALQLRSPGRMLTLRNGGDFADRQIRQYFTVALLCLGVAGTVISANHYVNLPALGFIITALAILFFKISFRRWSNWFIGKRGEEAVSQALKALSDDYALLNDLTIPDSRGNVDHLLIGPNGIFVIETKNYSGSVRCDGDRWFVGRRAVNSLSKQAKRNSMVIRASLTSLHPEKGFKVPYVSPLLVFVNNRIRLNLCTPTIPVLRLDELVDFVRNHKAAGMISENQKHAIVRHLQFLQSDTSHSQLHSSVRGS